MKRCYHKDIEILGHFDSTDRRFFMGDAVRCKKCKAVYNSRIVPSPWKKGKEAEALLIELGNPILQDSK